MTDSPYIFEVNQDNFSQVVLHGSQQVPVLVDFWAEWCGPCKMQLPVLLQLVEEHQGKFIVAKVNTDEQRALVEANGIRSLPTLRLYHQGQMVVEQLGAQTAASLRAMLAPYLARDSDAASTAARQTYAAGDVDEALTQMRAVLDADPDNHAARLDYARWNLQQGKLDEAKISIAALPADQQDAATLLSAQLGFAELAQGAAARPALEQALTSDASDHPARLQLAARLVLEEQYEAAMEQLLELLRRDRRFGDEAARKGLIRIFALLGEEDERVKPYRRKLFNLLH